MKTPKFTKRHLRVLRKPLLKSSEILEITDKGSGSQYFASNYRKVKEISKYAGMSWHQSKLVYKIIDYFSIKTVLELGTSVGLGSIAMSAHHSDTNIDTIEVCSNTFSFAKNQFKALGLENINIFNYDFSFFLKNISDRRNYDLIFLDGHHEKEATLEYFNLLQKHIYKYSVVILDDIYWSKGMQEAWETICKHEKVKVSIDLYFWGIVFFNPKLSKQHYKIRCFF